MPPVSVMLKPSSSLCNMSCDYCFYCDEARKRRESSYGFMSEQTLKNVIRKTMLAAEGAVSYVYQGGEPTLRGLDFFEKAVAYQKQYNKNGLIVQNSLQTNGMCLDENWCVFLKENHFLVGLSLDGTKEVHDALRHTKLGEGTFDRILRSAKLMDRYGVDYNILTVVTSQAAERVGEIYRFYEKNGWRYQQYIACLDPLGERHGESVYSLTPSVYGQFLIDLFDLWYRDWERGRQPYIRQFDNLVGMAAGYVPESCDQRGVCSIQNVVEADGSVYPCDFYMMDEYCLGNFNVDRLEQVDERRRETGFLERSRRIKEECLQCPHYRLCRGGCQRNRDLNVSTGLYENYLCEGLRKFFDVCGERIYQMGNALAQRGQN